RPRLHTNSGATRSAIATTAMAVLLITACSGSPGSPAASGMDHGAPPPPAASPHGGTPGMTDMPTDNGLTAETAGFRFTPVMSSLSADQPGSVQFRITSSDGQPVTALEPDQTKLMHFTSFAPTSPASSTSTPP
ncbi:MAG: hypothetical protein M3319_14155, partial [Actinomycetota bacterium]|nr:hypothetical protein [Actinomycetota bacterium]